MARNGSNNGNGKGLHVGSFVHKQVQRSNIPTEELRTFMTEAQRDQNPAVYERDPSLDPQLVWRGKATDDLDVPVVPIYIQEKIHPQAIVNMVRAANMDMTLQQAELFADFNGITFDKLVDFYNNPVHWSNRMILGDSLLTMTSLAEKEGLRGQVQMIYMDPPYGIKFGSNWQVSTRKRNVKDGRTDDMTRQPEQIKAFRDTWELGIHSYLSYLLDRLLVARELLTESGSVFVQIGDENVHLVRSVLDEVFGSENCVSNILVQKTSGQDQEYLDNTCDIIIWYAKNKLAMKYRQIYLDKAIGDKGASLAHYNKSIDLNGKRFDIDLDAYDPAQIERDKFRLYCLEDLSSRGSGGDTVFSFQWQKRIFYPVMGRHWRTHIEGLNRLILAERLEQSGSLPRYIRHLEDFSYFQLNNLWADVSTGGFLSRKKEYVVETNPKIIQRCMLMTTDPGDLVLDPTCGSGTTAYVAEQWGRRWITIDTSRVAIALARTRLMAARYPWYLLADSYEGAVKEAEITNLLIPGPHNAQEPDIRRGFVYERVPHVTLKSIANNEDIDTLYADFQAKMEPIRVELNQALSKAWEEWEIPREGSIDWSEDVRTLHADWWKLRRDRQIAIDKSIAAHAETELLYDKPYEDKKKVRVTGPFTIESLSPHRVIAPEVEQSASEVEGTRDDGAGQFTEIVLENLRKTGVKLAEQGTVMKLDQVESFAGTYLQASASYILESGKAQRVAICIGPQYGTVGPDLIHMAAVESREGLGFDLLLVLGFAFDPYAIQETHKPYGPLRVILSKMNPDLAMDDLLKKTGAGDLFMVFGEPDIVIERPGDEVLVLLRGVDVYDPRTGEIRSHTTDDIACWFIDTNYNGQSFFVRQAYFTGNNDPYERLRKTMRAEVNEDIWQMLYRTESQPFLPPATGKIAIKVINHYGDEVMKVYDIR